MGPGTAFCSPMEMARMLCGRGRPVKRVIRRRKVNPKDSPAKRVARLAGHPTPQREVKDFPR